MCRNEKNYKKACMIDAELDMLQTTMDEAKSRIDAKKPEGVSETEWSEIMAKRKAAYEQIKAEYDKKENECLALINAENNECCCGENCRCCDGEPKSKYNYDTVTFRFGDDKACYGTIKVSINDVDFGDEMVVNLGDKIESVLNMEFDDDQYDDDTETDDVDDDLDDEETTKNKDAYHIVMCAWNNLDFQNRMESMFGCGKNKNSKYKISGASIRPEYLEVVNEYFSVGREDILTACDRVVQFGFKNGEGFVFWNDDKNEYVYLTKQFITDNGVGKLKEVR